MAAGTVYAKRYGAGFTDNDNTKQVDAQFLNAVEAALLQLIGAAPTVDGQVAQWDNANTRFGPALLLNKNVDPAAAIASSKIDFTGANGLTNAAIAGAAAIARSKLNFGSGLVDTDISAAAAIGLAKLAGYPTDGTKFAAGDGTWKVPAVSLEVANSDLATFTNITATTEATAQTFATVTFTADGTTAYLLDAQWYATKGTTSIDFALYDGTDQGLVDSVTTTFVGARSYRWSRRLIPTAAAHTYTLRAWVDAGTGTAGGGAGGAGVSLPGFFRATKV